MRLAVAVALGLPILASDDLMGADVNNHAALAKLTHALWHREDLAMHNYVLRPLPYPYASAWVLAYPVGVLGYVWGVKCVFFLALYATWAATSALQKELGAPRAAVLAAGWIFYGASFFWGFVPTILGIPFVVAATFYMVRFDRTRSVKDGLITLSVMHTATQMHIVHLVAVVVLGVAFFIMHPKRNAWPAAVVLTSLCWSPLALAFTSPQQSAALRFNTWAQAGDHLRLGLCAMTLGRARFVTYAWTAVWCLFACVQKRHLRARHIRLSWALVLLGASSVVWLPREIKTSTSIAWGLDFRLVFLLQLGLCVAWPRFETKTMTALFTFLAALMLMLHGLDLMGINQRVQDEARNLHRLFALLPANASLAVRSSFYKPKGVWPPVGQHLSAMCVASGRCAWQSNLFMGGHVGLEATPTAQALADWVPKSWHQKVQNASDDAHAVDLGPIDCALMDTSAPLIAPLNMHERGFLGRWHLFCVKRLAD